MTSDAPDWVERRTAAYAAKGWEAHEPSGAEEDLLTKANAIVARLDSLTQQRRSLEDEEKFLRARLAVLLPIGTSKIGARSVSVRENKRFDAGRAAEVLTRTEFELCSVVSISPSRAREML